MSVVIQPKKLNPLLAAYLTSLAARPLVTKAITGGVLNLLGETIAGYAAGCPPPALSPKERTGLPPVDFLKRNHKAIKLALYGIFISAPLAHGGMIILQKLFAGKTSARAKLLQILVSNLTFSPIQQTVFISTMALINGATTPQQVYAAWRASIWGILRLTWVISTLSMATAQKFLAPELWVPFFNLVGACAGTFINTQTKKKQLLLARQKAAKDAAKADAEKK